jgi:hypothetical protein
MSANSYFTDFQNFIQGAFPIAPTLPPQLPSYNIVSTDYVVKLEQQIGELRTRNSELEEANANLRAELELMKSEDYAIKNEMIECKDAEINHLKYQVEFLQKEKYDEYDNHIEDTFKWSEEKTKLFKKIEELEKSTRKNDTGYMHEKVYIEPIFDTSTMSMRNYYSDDDDAAIPIDIDIDSEVEAIEEEPKITKCLKCKNIYNTKGNIIIDLNDDDIQEIPRCHDCSIIYTDRRGYMSYICENEYYGMYDNDGLFIPAEKHDDDDDDGDDNSSTNMVSD